MLIVLEKLQKKKTHGCMLSRSLSRPPSLSPDFILKVIPF